MPLKNLLPELKRVRNEVVFYLALIAGTAQFVVVQLDSVSFDNVEDYYGLGVVLLGLVQRLGAYGKETVAAIESRYS